MCDPVTGTVTAMSIMGWGSAVTAATGLVAQKQAASATDASNRRQATNALTARASNANQVGLQRQQASDAAGQKINANNQTQRAAQSSVVASAGPTGLSVENLLANLGTRGANYNQSVNENLDRTNMALDNQYENVNNSATSTINSLKAPAPVDYLGAALKIGTAVYSYNEKRDALKTSAPADSASN